MKKRILLIAFIIMSAFSFNLAAQCPVGQIEIQTCTTQTRWVWVQVGFIPVPIPYDVEVCTNACLDLEDNYT